MKLKKLCVSAVLALLTATLSTSCDEFLASEDNPVSAYLSVSDDPVTISIGETVTRKAVAASHAVVEYTSSDESVATVDQRGKVTGVSDGTATITVKVTGYSTSGQKTFIAAQTSYQVTVNGKEHTPLTLQAAEDNLTITVNYRGDLTSIVTHDITYKYFNAAGQQTGSGTIAKPDGPAPDDFNPITRTVTLAQEGDYIQLFGNNKAYGVDVDQFDLTNFTFDKDCYIYGNVMSLVDATNFATKKTLDADYALAGIFFDSMVLMNPTPTKHLKNHPDAKKKIYLPATTLTKGCYRSMFALTAITEAPELPAKEMKNECYMGMLSFTDLTAAPELPATTLAAHCYSGMFGACTNLTKAPELKATGLYEQCYYSMFADCSSLTKAPELPAEELARLCYGSMFTGCSSLTEAPVLKAQTLVNECYSSMFSNCRKLSSVTCLATSGVNGTNLKMWLSSAGKEATSRTLHVKNGQESSAWNAPTGTYSWTIVGDK